VPVTSGKWQRPTTRALAAGSLLAGAALALVAVLARHPAAGDRVVVAPAPAAQSTVLLAEEAATDKCTPPARTQIKPSLFCFAHMMPNSTEEGLMKAQLDKRVGLFSCNAYAVISEQKRWLGKDECDKDVFTWKEELPTPTKGHCDLAAGQTTGCTNSFLNTPVFMFIWDSLISSNLLWDHDWVVKMDADTVFLPERLRKHVTGKSGDPDHGLVQDPNVVPGKEKYFTTCWYTVAGHPDGLLYGSLEVFSKQAMWKFANQTKTCKNLAWQNWGEDLWIQNCMGAIGVPAVHDYHLIGDDNCQGLESGPCTDGIKAAYHPRKDIQSWFQCHGAATGR